MQLVSMGLIAAAISFGVCMTLSILLSFWRGRINSVVDDEGARRGRVHCGPLRCPARAGPHCAGQGPGQGLEPGAWGLGPPLSGWGRAGQHTRAQVAGSQRPPLLGAAAAHSNAAAPAGRASSSSGGYLTFNFLLNCMNWAVLLFLVVLISAFTV
jgi:hypothetical protein